MNIKVILADDHRIVREGLQRLLADVEGIEVIGEAENGRQTLQLVQKLKPDLVVMDISMPDLNGIEATQQILAKEKPPKIIALSMHTEKRFITEMLRAGAMGYLLKDCAREELALAINTVIRGKVYLSADIAGVVTKELTKMATTSESSPYTALSSREREILQLLAEGHGTKEIAQKLFVSVKTVETHRQNIMNKLDLHSIADLTKYAIREGITSLDD